MQLPFDRPAEVECHARVIDQGDAEMAAHEMEVCRHALFQTESGQWRRTHFSPQKTLSPTQIRDLYEPS